MTNKRNFGLDIIRALAITGVFLGHGITSLGSLSDGVELFFVLSGFLIGRIYFRSRRDNSFSLGQFWISRWWRTLPPYLAALGIIALAEHWIPSNPVNWSYLFFLQTFTGIKGFGPSWSLCVEEHFYLTLPLLAIAMERLIGKRHFIWLLPVAFFIPTLFRLGWMWHVGGLSHMPHEWYRMSQFHCDGLIAGVYLAYLIVERPEWFQRVRRPALILAPLAFLVAIVTPFLQGTILFESTQSLVVAIGFASWLRLAYEISWNPASVAGRLVQKIVRGIALASYSIYLLHTVGMSDLHILLHSWHRGAARSLFILSTTLVVCIVFYFIFERTSIRTRDRYLTWRTTQRTRQEVTV